MCTFFYNYRYAVCGCVLTAPDVPHQDRQVYLICDQGRFYPPGQCPKYTSGPDDARVATFIRGKCHNCQQVPAGTSLVTRPPTCLNLQAFTRQPTTRSTNSRIVAWLDDIDTAGGLPPIPDYIEPWFRAIASGRRGAGTTGAPMSVPPTTSGQMTIPQLYPNLFRDRAEPAEERAVASDDEIDVLGGIDLHSRESWFDS